jgi:hypothetical protein
MLQRHEHASLDDPLLTMRQTSSRRALLLAGRSILAPHVTTSTIQSGVLLSNRCMSSTGQRGQLCIANVEFPMAVTGRIPVMVRLSMAAVRRDLTTIYGALMLSYDFISVFERLPVAVEHGYTLPDKGFHSHAFVRNGTTR